MVYVENNKYGGFSRHPVYLSLTRLKEGLDADRAKLETTHDSEYRFKGEATCDDAFAEYLHFAAQRACREYYMKVVMFAMLYRECVNTNCGKLPTMPQVSTDVEYCAGHNADYLPDLSNEFVSGFLPKRDPKGLLIGVDVATELTLNFCHWLFINCYTCSLAMTKKSDKTTKSPEGVQKEEKKERHN